LRIDYLILSDAQDLFDMLNWRQSIFSAGLTLTNVDAAMALP